MQVQAKMSKFFTRLNFLGRGDSFKKGMTVQLSKFVHLLKNSEINCTQFELYIL